MSNDEFDFDEFDKLLDATATTDVENALEVEIPVPNVEEIDKKIDEIKKIKIESEVFKIDIADHDTRQRIIEEQIQPETNIFFEASSTTDTLDGRSLFCTLNEMTDTSKLRPDAIIVSIRSICGVFDYVNYKAPQPKAKHKRLDRGLNEANMNGKYRRNKKKKNANELNSQISFWVRRDTSRVYGPNEIIPASEPVYKFKIFRTGRIQLPGAIRSDYNNVIDCLNLVFDKIHTDLNTSVRPSISSLYVVMRDYKMGIKIPKNMIIDLDALKSVLIKSAANDLLDDIKLSETRYNDNSSLLFVTFNTPVLGKPEKHTSIKFFRSGSMTILGALSTESTKKVLAYLGKIIEAHYDEIVVLNGDMLTIKLNIPVTKDIIMPDDMPSIEDILNYRAMIGEGNNYRLFSTQ